MTACPACAPKIRAHIREANVNLATRTAGALWRNRYGVALCHVTEPDEIPGYRAMCLETPIGSVKVVGRRRPVNYCAKHDAGVIDAIKAGAVLGDRPAPAPTSAPRCTVHAAPGCADPAGPTFDGVSATPRIECAPCASYISA